MNNDLRPITTLPPFKRMCMTIGELPTSYLETMTYYEMLVWFTKYMQDTIIPNINNNVLAIQELQDKYIELKNYVDNYFDNLDVQEEINNKLDEMATDGSLTNLIKNYVDPIYQAYEEEINENIANFKEDVNNDIEDLENTTNNKLLEQDNKLLEQDNKINALESGAPLKASSTSDMTDTTRLYVNTTDGYVYYYNGSNWVQGWVYQSSQLSDEVLEELDSTAKFTIINLIDTSKSEHGYLQNNGSLGESAIYDTTDFIEVDSDSDYTIQSNYGRLAQFDSSKNIISGTYVGTAVATSNNLLHTEETTKYVRLTYYLNDTIPSMYKGNQLYNKILPYNETLTKYIYFSENMKNYLVNNFLNYDIGDNLYDISKAKENWGIYANTGIGQSYDTFDTSNIIPVNPSSQMVFNNPITKLLQYDAFMTPIQTTYDSSEHNAGYTFTTNENAHYIRFTYRKTASDIMVAYGTSIDEYKPFQKKLPENTILNETIKDEMLDYINENTGNILYNKKLTVLGDSYSSYTNATFNSGIYSGRDKVYPYLIGLRNHMTINNMAIPGSCMTFGYGSVNSCMNIYETIPTDSDYILIKYGINDMSHQASMGNIDDTVNNTFYGAWNTLMTWIYNNCPYAKVGIIVTNGLYLNTSSPNNSVWANAIIQIAKKYGIPTLNEWNDNQVPLLANTGRSDVSSTIRDLKNTAFRISAQDSHPNYKSHEYESYIVENYLRTL